MSAYELLAQIRKLLQVFESERPEFVKEWSQKIELLDEANLQKAQQIIAKEVALYQQSLLKSNQNFLNSLKQFKTTDIQNVFRQQEKNFTDAEQKKEAEILSKLNTL